MNEHELDPETPEECAMAWRKCCCLLMRRLTGGSPFDPGEGEYRGLFDCDGLVDAIPLDPVDYSIEGHARVTRWIYPEPTLRIRAGHWLYEDQRRHLPRAEKAYADLESAFKYEWQTYRGMWPGLTE